MSKIKLYHGSLDPKGFPEIVVDSRSKSSFRPNPDFGSGFYLTSNKDLACEWAVRNNLDGSLHTFVLDTDGLKILNLDQLPPLFRLGAILRNRKFPGFDEAEIKAINEKWYVDTEGYDVIVGSSADDWRKIIVEDFLTDRISYEGFSKAFVSQDPQYALKSQAACKNLHKCGDGRTVRSKKYFPEAQRRYADEYQDYNLILKEHKNHRSQELFFSDIIALNIAPDDKRLQSKKGRI